MSGLFAKYKYRLETETNTPVGQMIIKNAGYSTKPSSSLNLKPVTLYRDLSKLLGIGQKLQSATFVKHLRSPTPYFSDCNLIDKNKNLFNGKRSDILAKFDVKGKPYEKVSFHASPLQPFRDCWTDSHVNGITLSVRDQDGEMFDFNGMPIEFELEIN